MIRKAKFENFKGLKDVEITFDSPFTVLVGPNGTGKTSVLQGVEWLLTMVDNSDLKNQAEVYAPPATKDRLVVIIADDTDSGLSFVFSPLRVETSASGSKVLPEERRMVALQRGSASSEPASKSSFVWAHRRVLRPRFLSSDVAQATVTTSTPPSVSLTGGGLPSLLGYLKLRDDELFTRIETSLRILLPSVTKLRVDEQGGSNGLAAPKALLFDTTYAQKVPAHHMSDGTLYILALIVAVLGPHRPKTLLIDDIDMRLHPKAQYELVTLLKKFLVEFPDLQIIATSHSPYILDKLVPNEVRVTGLGDDGAVVIAPLTDHPAYEKWKDSMSPGEFWSHTGEEWLKKLKRSTPST